MEHEKYQDPKDYPGGLLMDELSRLETEFPEYRDKANYTGICSVISQEISARAIHESMKSIQHTNELAEFTPEQLEILANVAKTNSRWDEVQRIGRELDRRLEAGE